VYKERYLFSDGAVREMVLWKVPEASAERPHGMKYRLYYGLTDGTCVVRYDNESGKGDHRHVAGREIRYRFRDVETLVADFLADVALARGGGT